MTIISATLRLQALLLCCLVADLYGIATQQHFRKKRSNEQGLHFTSSCKEQRQQTEEDREQDRVISWHDDSLLNTCYFLLIYCLLTAEVDFKSCLWTQDKQIFPLKDSFFFQLLLGSESHSLALMFVRKKKTKTKWVSTFFLFFFSFELYFVGNFKLSEWHFMSWKTRVLMTRHMHRKKKMSMVSFARIFFVKFLKVKKRKKHAVYM